MNGTSSLENRSDASLLVSEQRAAELLGISSRTLWGLRANGQIPCVRVGRCVRYSVESLKRWIEEREGER